ncbi:hypothetical protein ABI59_09440 [Acidobacteria bacterium Mor1]|nr:hypothetical protein ABI59_09440 [Acidobacteria bacterium Mor1]
MPLAAGIDWRTPAFWLGLIYVTWPLNLLVYGWNDIVDEEIDRANPRKDSWLFGARGSSRQLASLPPLIGGVTLPFGAALTWFGGIWTLASLTGIVLANGLYNARIGGLRGRPPLDLVNCLGYLLVLELSLRLNDASPLPWQTFAYLGLFCVHAQLVGQVMDYYCDKAAGRRTSCTRLGILPTKGLIILLVAGEGVMLATLFGDLILGGMLLAGSAFLIFDALIYGRDRQYSVAEFRLAGLGMNAAGFVSMIWVWFSGSLVRLV